MKLTFVIAVLASCLVSAPASVVQQPTLTVVSGVVTDQNGSPVAGITVSLSDGIRNLETATTDEGEFYFELSVEAALTLTINAHGFSRFSQQLPATDQAQNNLQIVLRPAPISERVTVSVTRTETRIADNAASIAVLRAEDFETSAAVTLDDSLRQIPGFTLFRRSGSRTANPTTQGVSLRGLGASGASRAAVIADGVPLNDPFGGWVYWSRVPRNAIQQVEVLRGGASDLYGSSALSGVVNIVPRRPGSNEFSLETSYGNQETADGSFYWGHRLGNWSTSVSAGIFRTNGYVLVAPDERGPIDTAAGSRHSVVNFSVERSFGEHKRLFGSGSFFGESRGNGTPLQTNRTHIRQFALGGDWLADIGSFSGRVFGGTQVFDQNFSAISSNRNTETITRVQRVPAQFLGANGQWTRALASIHTIVAGLDAAQVRGASDEIVFIAGDATGLLGAGGRQATIGGYVQDVIRINSRVVLNAGIRVDHWRNYDSLITSSPFAAAPATTIFPDRTENAVSPRVSILFKAHERVSLTASVTRAFRAPTLNELYRTFRVGNVLTLANENLRAERVTNTEAGIRVSGLNDRVVVRSAFFWATVSEPVANVTLAVTPALITRQRQNLGRVRSRGVEVETETRFNQFWDLTAGYLFADATLAEFPANVALEGLMIPQVPRHQFTFQTRYTRPSIVTIGLQGRAASSQVDDDQNLFRLAPYFSLDAFVSRRINRNLDAFVAFENLLNQRYEIGRTPVTTLGPSLLVRAGIKIHMGAK
ncbi:MAG TPA: TonB-dependent receptor [Pyrinomonadaceae bacterium]|nr:TonB-dependent receptor [Pyrinomonadaceae bacterium]